MDSSSQGIFATRPVSRTRATGAVNRRPRRELEVFQDPPESSGRVNGQAAHVEIRVVSEQSRKRPPLGDVSTNDNRGSRMQMPPAASDGAKRGPKPGSRRHQLPPPTTRPATNRPSPTNVTVQPTRRSARQQNRPLPSQSAPVEDFPDPEDGPADEQGEMSDDGFVRLTQSSEEREEEDDIHHISQFLPEEEEYTVNIEEPPSQSSQQRHRARGRGRPRRHGRRFGELHSQAESISGPVYPSSAPRWRERLPSLQCLSISRRVLAP